MRDNVIGCLFGGKGKGKSTLAREVIREWKRVTIFDAHGEYGSDADDALVSCEVAWEKEESVALMLEAAKRPEFCISLRVSDDAEALDLWEMVWETPDQLVVVEEASRFCSPGLLPRQVAKVLRFGRHRGISQIYIAQRPSGVHRDVTANADWIAAFRQQEPRDLLYLRAVAGDDVDSLRTLPDYKVKVFGETAKLPVAVATRMVASVSPNQLDLPLESGDRPER